MTQTVLVKTYSASGRPDMFEIVQDNDKEEIKRLKRFGYSVVATGKPSSYTSEDAWEEYTRVDDDNFVQWKQS